MDLAYSLVDLNRDDGVTPQILFRAGLTLPSDDTGLPEIYNQMGMSQASLSLVGRVDGEADVAVHTYEFGQLPQAQQAAFMPTDTLSMTGPDGLTSANLSSEGYRSAVQMDRAYLENLMQNAYGLGYAQGSLVRSADSSVDRMTIDLPINTDWSNYSVFIVPELMDTMPYFELTPNTQVIFSGQLRAVASLQGSLMPVGQTRVYGHAIASVSVHRRLPSDGQTGWARLEDSVQAFDRQSQTLWANVGYTADEQIQEVLNSPFALTFTNESDTVLQGVLNTKAYTSLTFEGDLSTVPEPSTYALMALGFLGVAGAVRYRKT
jgi:hypothetical protein